MKLKYILVVSLLLTIIAMSAVSATDNVDNLTLSDDTVDTVSQDEEIDIIASDDWGTDELEQKENPEEWDDSILSSDNESIKDFKANFTEKLNKDDENYTQTTLASMYVPNNQTFSNIMVRVNGYYANDLYLDDNLGKNINLTYDDFILRMREYLDFWSRGWIAVGYTSKNTYF